MKNQFLRVGLLFITMIAVCTLSGQSDPKTDSLSFYSGLKNLQLNGNGAFNYYNFDWQTDSTKRNAIDHERFVLELGYAWTNKIRLNTEIEFEHGGTGSAVEFDRFEEFGEFEFEIEKGGEVLVEQMNIEFTLNKNLSLKAGRLKVPFAFAYEREEPTDYPTATYSEIEAQILPENWTENGIMLDGFIGQRHHWEYHAGIVNGLDGTAFNSANWIKRGNQKRFEMVNAENFAFCTRLDFKPSDHFTMGISAYAGNTTDNRPKPDLQVDAFVTIGEMHVMYQHRLAKVSSMFLYGALSNSEALSNQNRNLSNNLNVKRTPVAAASIGGFLEVESASLINHTSAVSQESINPQLSVYGRVDYYDTMYQTQGEIFNNPRWERISYTFGARLKIIEEVHIKTQYSIRKVGAPSPSNINGGTLEKTFVLGFAFEF